MVPREVKRKKKRKEKKIYIYIHTKYREIDISSDSYTDIQTAAPNTANLFPCVIKI